MKVKALLCSDMSIIDQNTNRVSVINIYDEIASPQFPVVVPNFSILVVLSRDDGDAESHTASVKISLNDQTLVDGPVLVDFAGTRSNRTVISLQGFVLPGPGSLDVSFLLEGERLGAWELPVRQLDPSVFVNGQAS